MDPALAVLVTGEIRIDQSLLEELKHLDRSSALPIISVWDKVGMKLDGWIGPHQIWRVLGEAAGDSFPQPLIGMDSLQRFIPEFFDALRADVSKRNVDHRVLEALTPYVDVEDQRLFVEVLPDDDRCCNARVIHYKMARAFALMKIEEDARGEKFDYVMRIRPDLADLPTWNGKVSSDEIFLDWFKYDKVTGACIAGDNAILARREMIADLMEYMRYCIYDQRRGNIHDIIGRFIDKNGLKPRVLATRFAEDPWPLDLFLDCVSRKAVTDPVAREFLACFRAWGCMKQGDLAAAATELDEMGPGRSPAVMLCRGSLAVMAGRLDEADATLADLRACGDAGDALELDYYIHKLEWLRSRHLEMEVSAVAS
jgi:hypothetical protein